MELCVLNLFLCCGVWGMTWDVRYAICMFCLIVASVNMLQFCNDISHYYYLRSLRILKKCLDDLVFFWTSMLYLLHAHPVVHVKFMKSLSWHFVLCNCNPARTKLCLVEETSTYETDEEDGALRENVRGRHSVTTKIQDKEEWRQLDDTAICNHGCKLLLLSSSVTLSSAMHGTCSWPSGCRLCNSWAVVLLRDGDCGSYVISLGPLTFLFKPCWPQESHLPVVPLVCLFVFVTRVCLQTLLCPVFCLISLQSNRHGPFTTLSFICTS